MKTIFRSTMTTLVFATLLALGAVAAFAQDPCSDSEGITKLDTTIRELLPKKGTQDRKAAIDAGKQFLEKYGACPGTKDFSDYLTATVPKLEKIYAAQVEAERKQKLIDKFNAGLDNKNWDDVYSSGKDLLAGYPDELRVIEVVLGSIGLDETAKTPKVTKWNDDTLKYAKQTIADIEAGKLTSWGVKQFAYKNREDTIGWMNYTIGYILSFDKDNKKDGAAYLYKATQVASDTKNNPVVYQSIGAYYYDQAKVLIPEIQSMVAAQDPKAADDVRLQQVNAIKAKVGLLNGTLERAMDAYSRAYALAQTAKQPNKAYTDSLFKTLTELYNVRFEKTDGVEAWAKSATTKPMPDPTTAITPVNDPDPSTTTTTTTSTTAPTPVEKPAAPAKPASTVKPQSSVTNSTKVSGPSATTTKPVAAVVVKKKGTK